MKDPDLQILEKDPQLLRVMQHTPLRLPALHPDVYLMLLKAIVEQQLSLKAAATIWNRFLTTMVEYPHPEHLLQTPVEVLRTCGLSYQKASYLHNIARFAGENRLDNDFLDGLDDREAAEHLTQIKGVGKWTAEMILMFSLGRKDIFPIDDLVIRNAMIDIYGLKSEKKQLYRELEEIAGQWRPVRSYACFILWDYYDVQVKGNKPYGL